MKKVSKLLAIVLVLSLSLGVMAFAASCPLRSGSIRGTGTLERSSSKSGTVLTAIDSHHLYYAASTIMAYDKNGKAISGSERTSRTAAGTSVTASKKVKYFKSSHAIKNDSYKPYCSNYLTVY